MQLTAQKRVIACAFYEDDAVETAANKGARPRSLSRRCLPGLRILVAEDNLLEADFVQRMLLDAGHEVVGPVARVVEALYLARQADIDGALLDINLAGRNSFAVAWCLEDRHLPFAFITAYPRSYLPGAGGLRSVPVIAKPVSEQDVLDIVASFGDRRTRAAPIANFTDGSPLGSARQALACRSPARAAAASQKKPPASEDGRPIGRNGQDQ
jgi:CheY-like chemotaxis protein